jgi:hypothetical protein
MPASAMLSFFRNQSIDLGQTFFLGHIPVSFSQTVAELIEAVIHAADAGEQFRIHQSGYRLTILADDDAVITVLNLIEHLPQILPEIHGIDFGNHPSISIVIIDMVIMAVRVPDVQIVHRRQKVGICTAEKVVGC